MIAAEADIRIQALEKSLHLLARDEITLKADKITIEATGELRLGSKDRYDYDAGGNLTSHIRADASTVHFAYDERDNLTGILDAEGQAWKRRYDGIDLVEETDPLGHRTRYLYNADHLPIEITDAKGGKQLLRYGALGELLSHTDCSGKTSRWAYDDRGRLVTATNSAGEVTGYEYDRGHLSAVIQPGGRREHLAHDAEGRLVLYRDLGLYETHYRYNEAGLIDQRTDANGHTIAYRWDRLGRLVTLRNENRREHRLTYDPLGRLVTEVHFDDARTDYIHDPATGVLAQIRDAGGVTEVRFDAMGRLVSRKAALFLQPRVDPATGKPAHHTIDPESRIQETYGYSPSGRLVDAKNAAIHLQWFHDPVGNLVTEHQHHLFDRDLRPIEGSETAVWTHRYDELGNRISTVRPDGHSTTWLMYGSGHVHGLLLDGEEVVQFERDHLHREVKRIQSNGVVEERRYDRGGRLEAIKVERIRRPGPDGSLPPASRLDTTRKYRYDAAGLISHIEDWRRGDHSYQYDPVGRLLRADGPLGAEVFAFDPAGNILDLDTRDDAPRDQRLPAVLDNRVRDYAGSHYEYDLRGNVTRRTYNLVPTRFFWDALGRMREACTPDTRVTYLYDPLGRRLAKRSEPIVFDLNRGGARWHETEVARVAKERGLGTTLYGWDGDLMAWEADYERAEISHFVYEADTFVPLIQATTSFDPWDSFLKRPFDRVTNYVDAAGNYDGNAETGNNSAYSSSIHLTESGAVPFGNIYFYQSDHIGTPLDLTHKGGDLEWEGRYKIWGRLRTVPRAYEPVSTPDSPHRFQGQYFDPETETHDNRYRHYDPFTGRFLSKDPLGLQGGINLYEYGPNPLQWIDPLGLARKKRPSYPSLAPCQECSQCPEYIAPTSNAARKYVMRQAGIPTSQQPISQSQNDSGREYSYVVPVSPNGGSQRMSVQQQTMDCSHPGQAHWEAGAVKTKQYNKYGRPRLQKGKSKANY